MTRTQEERILVCIDVSPAANLINSAKTMAIRHDAKWFAVTVEEPKAALRPEAERNRELMGGGHHCFTLADATHKLTPTGLRLNLSIERMTRVMWLRGMARLLLWMLTKTFPFRRRLGLYKSKNVLGEGGEEGQRSQ